MNDLNRALAASDAVAVIMLGLSAFVLWYRRIGPPPAEDTAPPANAANVEQMLTSLAVVLSGLAVRYAVNVGSLLGYWSPSSPNEVIVRLLLVYVVIGASITALRTVTYPVYGNGATLVFVGVGLLAAFALFIWA
jgi:hypothetical protein